MEKIAVILGAGASYDVHNGEVPLGSETWRPPLARELFQPRFWPLQEPYPGAVVIGAELAPEAAKGAATFAFETRLTSFAASANPRTRRHFMDVPPYLRDVLVRCSTSYDPIGSNYLRLVRRLLEPMRHEVMFIVLNYDTILETALTKYDPQFQFASLPDYVAHDAVKVVKVHGSVDWFVPVPGSSSKSWSDAFDGFDPNDPENGSRISVNRAGYQTFNMRIENGVDPPLCGYPWLTAPVIDKELRCPRYHTEALHSFVADCTRFLVIGTSGLDDDLLRELALATKGSLARSIQYVDTNDTVKARFERVIPAFKDGANGNPPARVWVEGFAKYLLSDELAFLVVPP